MNNTTDNVYTTATVKPLKFSPSVFINIISAQREIYLDKRDYYADYYWEFLERMILLNR